MDLQKNIPIVTHIRLAKKRDLLLGPGLLKFGQPFYLFSHKTGKFEGVYVLNVDHVAKEIEVWYNANMIYVPVNVFENPITRLSDDFIPQNMKTA